MKLIQTAVPVLASFNSAGDPQPLCFRYHGKIYRIEKVFTSTRSTRWDCDGFFFLVESCRRQALLFWRRRDNVWILEKF